MAKSFSVDGIKTGPIYFFLMKIFKKIDGERK